MIKHICLILLSCHTINACSSFSCGPQESPAVNLLMAKKPSLIRITLTEDEANNEHKERIAANRQHQEYAQNYKNTIKEALSTIPTERQFDLATQTNSFISGELCLENLVDIINLFNGIPQDQWSDFSARCKSLDGWYSQYPLNYYCADVRDHSNYKIEIAKLLSPLEIGLQKDIAEKMSSVFYLHDDENFYTVDDFKRIARLLMVMEQEDRYAFVNNCQTLRKTGKNYLRYLYEFGEIPGKRWRDFKITI